MTDDEPIKKSKIRAFRRNGVLSISRPQAPMVGELTREVALTILARGAFGAKIGLDLPPNEVEGNIFVHCPAFTTQARFNLKNRNLEIMTLNVRDQERGIGRREAAKFALFAHGAGLRTMRLATTDDAGGYFAAKIGSEAVDVKSQAFDYFTRAHGEQRLRALQPYLTADERSQVAAVLAFSEARSVWDVADLPIDLGPRLRGVFAKTRLSMAARGQRQNLREAFNRTILSTDETRGAQFYKRLEQGKKLPIGHYLMVGALWENVFRLDDPVPMKRLRAYNAIT